MRRAARERYGFQIRASPTFCNIHLDYERGGPRPDNALVRRGRHRGAFSLQAPAGSYALHVWVEGAPQGGLDRLTKVVHIDAAHADLGDIAVQATLGVAHTNKFGQPYTRPSVVYQSILTIENSGISVSGVSLGETLIKVVAPATPTGKMLKLVDKAYFS